MSDNALPIAGWYPDPENAAAERWWDGTGWSDHRRASTVAPVAPATPVAAPAAPVDPAAGGFVAPGVAPSATVNPYATPAAQTPAAQAPVAQAPAQPAYGAYATTPGQPGQQAYAAPVYTPATPANSIAVVGLVVSLVGLVFSFGGLTALAGAIISIVALARANRMRAQGLAGDRRGMAIGGLIAGILIFLLDVAAIILLFAVVLNDPSFTSSTFGDSSFS